VTSSSQTRLTSEINLTSPCGPVQVSARLIETSAAKHAVVRTPERQPLSPANREMGSGGPKQSLKKPQHSPFAKAKLPATSPLKPSIGTTTPKHRADNRGNQHLALGEEPDNPIFSLDMGDGHSNLPLQVSDSLNLRVIKYIIVTGGRQSQNYR
jgi:hypothetical protein